jgi:hypothetical protein
VVALQLTVVRVMPAAAIVGSQPVVDLADDRGLLRLSASGGKVKLA